MPIYEYECLKCGKTTEAMQKFSDPPITECGHCSGEMRKLISMSSFHLKGSGWYVTDYSGKTQSGSSSLNNETSTVEKTEKVEAKTDSTSASSSE